MSVGNDPVKTAAKTNSTTKQLLIDMLSTNRVTFLLSSLNQMEVFYAVGTWQPLTFVQYNMILVGSLFQVEQTIGDNKIAVTRHHSQLKKLIRAYHF
jgi:hypothetical protein